MRFHKPVDARPAGIEVVYQDLAICNNLTASANVFLGREVMKGFWPVRILDNWNMSSRSKELFAELKSETRPDDVVRSMSGGQRQAVAIARTHLSKAKIVLMDEPTAAISVRQVAEVLDLLKRLRDQGMAVVLISHRMPDVFAVADQIVVLRRGHKVADKPISAELARRGHGAHHRRNQGCLEGEHMTRLHPPIDTGYAAPRPSLCRKFSPNRPSG